MTANTSAGSRTLVWRAALVLLLAVGAILRLYDLADPPLDFHATRQLRNSLVARAIYYDVLPHADVAKRALADSFRRSVGLYEPPIIESLTAFTYLLTGESIAVPRIYQTLFWLLAGIALFDLARRISSVPAGLVALAYYLVLPFSVQASRSFQPDPLMAATFLAGVYFLFRWAEDPSWKWAVLAGALLGFAALVKIVIALLVGGAVIGLLLSMRMPRVWKSRQLWAMAALMILPAFAYYVLGTPGRSSEYFFAWTVTLFQIVLSPEFYADWLAFLGSLFGLTVVLLGLVGTLLAPPRARSLLLGIWVGYLFYGLTLPFQMYTHSYYHVQLIPIVALGLACAASPILERLAAETIWWRFSLTVVLVAGFGYQAWVARSVLAAEDFRHEPAFWRQVGDSIPDDALVIALTQDYGYRLMYWGWRKVSLWPILTDLSTARGGTQDASANFGALTAGQEYFLVTAYNQLEKQPGLARILAGLPIAAQGNGFVLYDLRK